MKNFRLGTLVPSLLLAAALVEPLNAAPIRLTAPSVQTSHVQAQAVCHHHRWSSRRACTSARTLTFAARPPLYYPHRYFGGAPHYADRLYWHNYAMYRYRWYNWPYGY